MRSQCCAPTYSSSSNRFSLPLDKQTSAYMVPTIYTPSLPSVVFPIRHQAPTLALFVFSHIDNFTASRLKITEMERQMAPEEKVRTWLLVRQSIQPGSKQSRRCQMDTLPGGPNDLR